MNTAISELANQMKEALSEVEATHKSLEEAQAKLSPLENAAKQADAKLEAVIRQFQSATSTEPTQKASRAVSVKKTRAPRSLAAIVGTAATRMLGEMHKEGKQKKQALNSALDRAELLATSRSETVTEEIKAAITAKADEIWSKK